MYALDEFESSLKFIGWDLGTGRGHTACDMHCTTQVATILILDQRDGRNSCMHVRMYVLTLEQNMYVCMYVLTLEQNMYVCMYLP